MKAVVKDHTGKHGSFQRYLACVNKFGRMHSLLKCISPTATPLRENSHTHARANLPKNFTHAAVILSSMGKNVISLLLPLVKMKGSGSCSPASRRNFEK